MNQTKVLILGAGSWGQALASVFSRATKVTLWMRSADKIESVKSKLENTGNHNITFTANASLKSLEQYDLVIIATPMNALRSMLNLIATNSIQAHNAQPDQLNLFVTCKGLEQNTGELAYEIVQDVLPNLKTFGILVGPSFASELLKGMPTLIALSSLNHEFTVKWINLLKIPNFRIYGHSDIIGACAASALKNVIAIAVGISCGLAMGQNASAALITRGLHEMKKFIMALGGTESSVYGLTGMGDLILTCHEQSRNYKVGMQLAQGQSIDQILQNLGHIAEGVSTAKEIYFKAQTLNIDMPISNIVYKIIYEQMNIKDAITALLDRPNKMEF